MKKVLTIALAILALPVVSSALTVRTEQRASSGGVTVSEGAATATGDQNSSVSVQNVISGTRGHVQVTTVKDGVTTTESHDINGGSSVIVTPPQQPAPDTIGRTPREPRGVVAVQTSNSGASTQSVTARSSAKTKNMSKNSNSSIFALVQVSPNATQQSLSAPAIVHSVQVSAGSGAQAPVPGLFTRILRWCGFST